MAFHPFLTLGITAVIANNDGFKIAIIRHYPFLPTNKSE